MRRFHAVALLLALLVPSVAPAEVVLLDQGWSGADRRWMYGFSQGSRIMPYAWFRALEEADGTRPFRHDRLARFGYLPRPAGEAPDNLPVGFGTDENRRGLWLGMNCTACHTGRVEHGGRVIQVDGAPANADLQGFIRALDGAMRATLDDPAKFARFAAVARRSGERAAPDALREQLRDFSESWTRFVDWSTPAHEWGPARADAFNMIFNRVAAIDMNAPENARPPEAPVSYPFLWDTHGQEWVQWSGNIDNDEWFERLGRNAGQVLGVFGQMPGLASREAFAARGFESSLRGRALLLAEAQYARLRPPSWTRAGLPSPDADAAARGAQIYAALGCGSCHTGRGTLTAISPPDGAGPGFPAVGTDPLTARMIVARRVRSATLEGWEGGLLGRAPLPAEMPAATLLKLVVSQSLVDWSTWRLGSVGLVSRLRGPSDGPSAASGQASLAERVARDSHAAGSAPFALPPGEVPRLNYKAGPLRGIWATGPFLHNGSVPTLDALLRPAAERPKQFRVGGRVLDTERVGFVFEGPQAGAFVFDTALPGNGNAGHEGYAYGTLLEEWQRRDLLEYLKGL